MNRTKRTAKTRTTSKLRSKRSDLCLLHTVVDDLSEGLLVESGERVVYINWAFSSLLAYRRPAELLDRHLSDIAAEEDLPRLLDFGRRRSEGKEAPGRYEFLARRKDGGKVRLDASISTCTVADCLLITTVVRPVLEHPTAHDRAGEPMFDLSPLPGVHLKLTARELEVMEMILQGSRTKEIAFTLGLSEKTVATHRARMMKKMNLLNSKQLFQYALQHGLIDWK